MASIFYKTILITTIFLMGALGLKAEEKEKLSSSRLWALSLGAILTQQNEGDPRLLGGFERSPRSIDWAKDILKNSWRITNKTELLDTLKNLKEKGHREEFEKLQKEYSKYSSMKVQEKKKVIGDEKMTKRINVILERGSLLGDQGILAWDLGRSVNVAAWGYHAGYLTESEAWKQIDLCIPWAQKSFKSWNEYALSYQVGRQFWNGEISGEEVDKISKIVSKLLNDPHSPWIEYAWKENFDE